jgi:hypothetical protein
LVDNLRFHPRFEATFSLLFVGKLGTRSGVKNRNAFRVGRFQIVVAGIFLAAILPTVASPLFAQSVELPVYRDGLTSGFVDGSSAPRTLNSTEQTRGGLSIKWSVGPWNGLVFSTPTPVPIAGYGALQMWVNGGATGFQEFTVEVKDGNELVAGSAVVKLLGHSIQPYTWERVQLPIEQSSLIRQTSVIRQIVLYADTAKTQAPMYVDDISFVSRSIVASPGSLPPIFPEANTNCVSGSIKIMPLGDSLTAYAESYRGPLNRALLGNGYDVEFVGSQSIPPIGGGDPDNEGHGGAEIGPGGPNNINDNVGTWLHRENPDIVLLDIGANDVGGRRSLAIEASNKLGALVQRIVGELPTARVLVADIPPNGWQLDTFYEQRDVNEMAQILGDLSPSDVVVHVPVWPRLRAGWNTQFDTYDKVHFTPSGGERFAAAWMPEVLNAIAELSCGQGSPPTTTAPPTTVPRTTPATTTPGTTRPTTPPSTGGYSIGNQVFNDANNDGFFNGNETGLAGVTLRLYNNQSPTGVSTTTSSSGSYSFGSLGASQNYQVCVDPFAPFVGSNGLGTANWAAGDATSYDPNDIVDNDDNAKTLWDGKHCTGHIIIDATHQNNQRVDIGLFNPGGTNTPPVPTTIATTTATTSAPSPTTRPTTATTTPTSGGYVLGNQIFNDANNNGFFDSNEVGLAGVTVRLRNLQQDTGRSSVTDSSGRYSFTGLGASNDYQVCIDQVSGFVGSNGSGTSSPSASDVTANDPNNIVDNDDNGKTLWDGAHCTGHIILSSSLSTNQRVDIGLYRR